MQKIFLFMLVLTSVSCKTKQMAIREDLSPKLSPLAQFEKELNESLNTKDHQDFLKFIESDYRDEQLEFLGGDAIQLVDELFCGKDQNGDFNCPKFTDIVVIKFVTYETGKVLDKQSSVIVIVNKGPKKIISSAMVVRGEGGKFKLAGASG